MQQEDGMLLLGLDRNDALTVVRKAHCAVCVYPAQFSEAMVQSIKSGRVGRGSQIRSDKTTRPSESR